MFTKMNKIECCMTDQGKRLDRKTLDLIKVGICVGAGLETATQRHAMMAKENGASDEEIYQAVLIAMTTCGPPKAAAGWKWAHSAIEEK